MAGEKDGLVDGAKLLGKVGDWRAFLAKEVVAGDVRWLQRHERTGRPLGSEKFVARLERRLGRRLRRLKPGPKPRRR
jgi:putative transposase